MRLYLFGQGIGIFIGSVAIFIALNIARRFDGLPESLERGLGWLLGDSLSLEQIDLVITVIEGIGALLMLVSFVLIIAGLAWPSRSSKKQTIISMSREESLYCSQCGTKVPSNSTFCNNCGEKIK